MKWKIGDWAAGGVSGKRWLIVFVESDGISNLQGVGLPDDRVITALSGDHLTPLPDCDSWTWQPPKPEPTYRPFANALEFAPHVNRLIACAAGYACVRRFSESTVVFGTSGKLTYDELFKYCQFADIIDGKFVYSPCGVPE